MRCCVAFLVVALVTLVSCKRDALLYVYNPVDSEGWSRQDTLSFDIDSVPVSGMYTISLGLRFTDRMPYRQISLVLEQRLYDTGDIFTLRCDTLNMFLSDSLSRWKAQGNSLYGREDIVRAAQLVQGQHIEWRVYHIMIPSMVPGITDVGLKVE
jgi:gliding motility-associated lipoprotein GldH